MPLGIIVYGRMGTERTNVSQRTRSSETDLWSFLWGMRIQKAKTGIQSLAERCFDTVQSAAERKRIQLLRVVLQQPYPYVYDLYLLSLINNLLSFYWSYHYYYQSSYCSHIGLAIFASVKPLWFLFRLFTQHAIYGNNLVFSV